MRTAQMKSVIVKTIGAVPLVLIVNGFFAPRCGATVYHSDGSAASVQQIHNRQVHDGDTITIPAGNFTWGADSVHVTKALTIQGAGQGTTNITVTATPTITLTKTVNGPIRVQQLSFTGSGGGQMPHFIAINGPWPNGKPVIFENVTFNAHRSTMVGVLSPGGVIFSHIAFVGEWDNALVTVNHNSSASWTTPDTMGARDTTGCANVYIEDSTFVGGSNGISDCDDGCRMVLRHNIFGYGGRDSGGPNSHGQDTSPFGMRHMEIYDNQFLFPDHTCKNCLGGNQCLSNVNQFIWIRGGTGVIFDNYFDHLSSKCWGTKTEIRFDIRGAEDARPQGSCANTHYPVPHQIGQTLNGTDPIWIWGNTGQSVVNVQTAWSWGNPCGLDCNTFFQWHRDAENTSLPNPTVLPHQGGAVSGLGGTPKPGYTPYTYPHPLRSSPPAATQSATPSSVQDHVGPDSSSRLELGRAVSNR
jgi:hypothetical protein